MQGNISDVIYVLHYYDGVPSFLMAEDVGEGEKEAEEEAEVSVQLVHLLMTGWRCSLLCERLCLFPRAVHKDHMYLYQTAGGLGYLFDKKCVGLELLIASIIDKK